MKDARLVVPWMLAGAMALVVVASAQGQASDPQLARILADWEKRQLAVDSIRYEVKGQHVIPKGSLRDNYGMPVTPPAPEQEIAGDVKWSVLLDFRTGRHRRDIFEQVYDFQAKRFYPRFSIDACDGKTVHSAMPRDKNTSEVSTPPADRPDLVIIKGNLRGVPFHSEYLPLFFGHGIIRTMIDEVVPGRLRNKPNPDYLVYHGQGVHGGVPCVVVRTQTLQLSSTSFDEFWVDPTRESAIVRYVMYSGKRIFNDIDIKYQKTAQGWLPERWTFTHYSGTAPSVVYRMRVASWTADPAINDSEFKIPISPGMLVEETEFGESAHPLVNPKSATRVYRYGEDGDKTEVADPFGRPRTLHESKWWYWAGGGALALAIGGFVMWRVRRDRHASSAASSA